MYFLWAVYMVKLTFVQNSIRATVDLRNITFIN